MLHRINPCYISSRQELPAGAQIDPPMYIVDDPTLALISRFVGGAERPDLSDEEFFHQQLSAIEAHVQRFPEAERESRALEWIQNNARQYRQQWQKQAATELLETSRCPDCPLAGGDQQTPCAIHRHWLALLNRYVTNRLSSHEYVKKSLELLAAYKDGLRVRHARAGEGLRCGQPAAGFLPGATDQQCNAALSGSPAANSTPASRHDDRPAPQRPSSVNHQNGYWQAPRAGS